MVLIAEIAFMVVFAIGVLLAMWHPDDDPPVCEEEHDHEHH